MDLIIKTKSAFLLIIVNVIPLLGVIFWGWDMGVIIFSYWLESGIIGLSNVVKMLLVKNNRPIKKLIAVPFFILHYGSFWIFHGVFLYAILNTGRMLPDFFSFLPALKLMFYALSLSHAISLFYNFIMKGEREKAILESLMTEPYKRVVVMHVTIIIGMFPFILLGRNTSFLIVMVILKLLLDLKAHIQQHKKYYKND